MTESSSELVRFVEAPRERVDLDGGRFTDEERRIVADVNDQVAAGNSLGDVMNYVFEHTHDIFPGDRIGLAFVDEDGARVTSRWGRADYEPLRLRVGYSEDFHGSSLETVYREGCLRIISDLEAYLDEHPESRSTRLLVREGVRSSMTCPLYVEKRPVALFFRSSRQPRAYGERELSLHSAIAQRLSQAVEKAYRMDQLESANHAYVEMLGFVSHEIKNPLGTIITGVKTLTDGYLGDMDPKHKDVLNRVERKAEYLLQLVKEYLDLARLEEGQVELRYAITDMIADIIEPSIEVIADANTDKKMTIVKEYETNPLHVACDPNLLKIVVVNLIGNAIKYGDDGGTVKITAKSDESQAYVSVWNTGPGFPPDQQNRLFRKFSRVNTKELMSRPGSGVGLYTCWRLIRFHKGQISARSELGKWAEFTFTIPLRPPEQKDGI